MTGKSPLKWTNRFVGLLGMLLLGFAPSPGLAGNAIVTDVSSLSVGNSRFATLKVRLQTAPAGPVTVTLNEVDGGSENIYISTSCRFWLYLGGESWSQVDVGLFDLETPATVANFLAYVADGAYQNTFVHRKVTDFVVQGGGYFLDPSGNVQHIDTLPPVVNEPMRSNLRGTLAMAKVGGDPHSATSEWFFNVGDNRANLDFQNGGFTVFGQVLDDGMTVVDAINTFPTLTYQGLEGIPYYGDYNLVLNGWHDQEVYVPAVEVLAGRELVFGPDDWNVWYEVKIHVAPAGDTFHGERLVRLSAPGMADRQVVVNEMAVGIVLQEPVPAIPEGGAAEIWLKLAAPPHGEVTVAAEWVAGDPDIGVSLPGRVSFSADDWDVYKAVTLTAAEDDDAVDGEAIVRFFGPGVYPEETVVREADNDVLSVETDIAGPIVVPEGGTTTFRVRLTAQPVEAFVLPIVRIAGDPDLDVVLDARFNTPLGPVEVAFHPSDAPHATYNFCRYVLFEAFNGIFFHRHLDAPAILESGLYGYNAGEDYYFRVDELPAEPVDPATPANLRGTLAMNLYPMGDGGEVVASHWFFNLGDNAEALVDYPVFGRVVGDGLAVLDQIVALPTYDLETALEVDVGGDLAAVPMRDWTSGGEAEPGNLVVVDVEWLTPPPFFTPGNWDQWQEVTLRALPDDDFMDGEATFAMSPLGGEVRELVAIERDSALKIVVEAEELAVPEGTTQALGVKLSRAPDAPLTLSAEPAPAGDPDLILVLGATLNFTPENWDVWQFVEIMAVVDDDAEDGETTLTISQVTGTDIVANVVAVRVHELDKHVLVAFTAAGSGQTVPAGQALIDATADLPLAIEAVADPGFALLRWEPTADIDLGHPRQPATAIVAASASGTVTAVFSEDADGDGLPDVWELQYVDDVAWLDPDADPNRSGRTTQEEFLAQTHPLLYEIGLSPGWNALGFSAIPRNDAVASWPTAEGGSEEPLLAADIVWQWHPTVGAYRATDTVDVGIGYWVYADTGGTLGVTVLPDAPPDTVHLSAGWNFITPPSPAWNGTLAEIFGDAVEGVAYRWTDGRFARSDEEHEDEVQVKRPMWLFAPAPRQLAQ